MRRRSFIAALPAAFLAAPALAANPFADPYPEVRGGDRIGGAGFASRSTVWGAHGAAATAHPLATLTAIDILRRGGSAVDAAIAANAALAFLEPVSCGLGGDAFALLWDPRAKKVVGLNGSGRSPRGLSLETVRRQARNGRIEPYGAVSISVPGAVDAWWSLHQRYGKLPWKDIITPAADLAEAGAPTPQFIALGIGLVMQGLIDHAGQIEELDNARHTYLPTGKGPLEGETFANPDLARTLRTIAAGGRDAFYGSEIAKTVERYFTRVGGWMTRADLAAHRSEWVEPLRTDYRGVAVHGLGPNTQGLTTLQMLNIMETFDLKGMDFQSAASLHHQAEAKRLAFEDRARWFADPAFSRTPVEMLLSKDYARRRAALIRPDRPMERTFPGDAPAHGDTTYLTVSDRDGMMVSLIQSNFEGMGAGLVPDGLGFMFQNRGSLFALTDGHPNVYAPGKRPFQTIIPGFATKDGKPWLSFGVMGGAMQPQGQVQIISNLVDYGLGLQEAGDSPRWRHDGSPEPTGQAGRGVGMLDLERGVPGETRKRLADMGWSVGPGGSGFGGYQAIERTADAYGGASEMRKDGLALAY
jgi:gamma-glutamyltranspeptidase/glutathione hydrolase